MMAARRFHRTPDSGSADSQPVERAPLAVERELQIVGGADQLGGLISRPSLPAPHDVLDTAELGRLFWSHRKHPAICAWHWITVRQIPHDRVGNRIVVTGQSVRDAIRDAGRSARHAKRQRRMKAVAS